MEKTKVVQNVVENPEIPRRSVVSQRFFHASKKRSNHTSKNPSRILASLGSTAAYKHNRVKVSLKTITNRKVREKLRHQQLLQEESAKCLAASEIILPNSEGSLKSDQVITKKITQRDIIASVGLAIAKKAFDFSLSYGPYRVDYARNGRHLLFGGTKGSIALLDCHTMDALTEINVEETVRDVKFLHDHTMFAVAQKKYLYIYDNDGIEQHCLRDTAMTYRLEYLPFHFLLATIGDFGTLRYQDISTGQVVAKHSTKLGSCNVMCQNPKNAVIHLGHNNGNVTLWTPNMGKPAVKMLTHRGPLTAIDVYDNYMVTAGFDGKWRLWDIRKYDFLYDRFFYGSPPSDICISHTGMMGIAFGPHVQVWKDIYNEENRSKQPYIQHDYNGQLVSSIKFRPFEDILGVGLDGGISALIVPGSGKPNFDTFAANPFQTAKQRSESQVRNLMDKIPADMITVDT